MLERQLNDLILYFLSYGCMPVEFFWAGNKQKSYPNLNSSSERIINQLDKKGTFGRQQKISKILF